MLKTRLWMGALLIAVGWLIFVEDLAPWYPALILAILAASGLATSELLEMLDPASRPSAPLCYVGVLLILALNWHVPLGIPLDFWHLVGFVIVEIGIAAFLLEMWNFKGPNHIVERISQTIFVVFYLGVLPSFFLQLRWRPEHAALAMAMTVFVPKSNDIGAYFTGKFLTGRILGRTPMTPLLSPKKTWQGFVGGMLTSSAVAVSLASIAPIFPCTLTAIGFGLTVGLAGVLGDLAESLIKRDRQTKDASASVPGFGGVLDVIDSLLFAAPVAYWWFIT